MCGIAGLFSFEGSKPVVPADLDAMQKSMAHRGPDGDGIWTDDAHRVGLAHRRLAIVDLSDSARQPMANEDGTVVITFNGEIYNHMKLRPQLEAAGHVFRTGHSDTEVLVHGYEEWGLDGLLERLDGMFAFAIWDQSQGVLSLARDRVGIKPVYFTRCNGSFRFASEIKALLTDPSVQRDIEPAAFNHYLTFMIPPAPLTMFKGIYKLPAGHLLQVGGTGDMSARRYWDAVPGKGFDAQDLTGKSVAEQEAFYTGGILQRLESAIEKRMMSDVPFGVFLSGGIDSSANVALMCRHMDRPVDTFTVGFKDHPHLNELSYADRVARQFGTNHHEVLIDENDMTGYLDELIHHQDEPISDWVCVPLHFVSKLAKDSGVTVVQVGEGSDEQFAGYRNYMMYMQLHRQFWRYLQRLPRALRVAMAAMARSISMTPRMDRVTDILTRSARGQELFWGASHAFWNVHKDRTVIPGAFSGCRGWPDLSGAGLDMFGLADTDSGAVVGAMMKALDNSQPGCDLLARMVHSEFRIRLAELLLMRVDKITMANSIEGRVPFLDHRLVEFSMDIPMAWKVRGGEPKYLLKQALKGILPDDILYRPKMGFGAPMAQWLRSEFGKHAESTVLGSGLMERGLLNQNHIARMFREHRSGKRDHELHLWILFNAAAWYDRWIGGR